MEHMLESSEPWHGDRGKEDLDSPVTCVQGNVGFHQGTDDARETANKVDGTASER